MKDNKRYPKIVSARVPLKISDRLKLIAKKYDLSLSACMRRVLKKYLQTVEPRKTSRPTMFLSDLREY